MFLRKQVAYLTFISTLLFALTISVIHSSEYQAQSHQLAFFRKQSLENSTSLWEINGRYSKGETACIENCVRQGGVNCGGVLYFSCCATQEECLSYPFGICRCSKILPNFGCFRSS